MFLFITNPPFPPHIPTLLLQMSYNNNAMKKKTTESAGVKLDTRSFLQWWFTANNVPVPTTTKATEAIAATPISTKTEFSYEVVAMAELEPSLPLSAPSSDLVSTSFGMKSEPMVPTGSPFARPSANVVGFMDYDPKTAASKNHRGRSSSWMKN